jgi:hypothetical protein
MVTQRIARLTTEALPCQSNGAMKRGVGRWSSNLVETQRQSSRSRKWNELPNRTTSITQTNLETSG